MLDPQIELANLLETFQGLPRQSAQIRALARKHPLLSDSIPDEVYEIVYCVRALGTQSPPIQTVSDYLVYRFDKVTEREDW